jgi:HD-GYP domain-containing protein (c-di-GMP phosphodiesterase class II)
LKLVPFKSDYLRLDETLPFGLRDGTGRLLLAAGHKISNSDRMDELRQQPLFADESESSQWYRRLAAAVDERFRQGAELREVAQARPDETVREASVARTLTLTEDWTEIVSRLDAVLRDVRPDSDWRPRLMAIHLRARQLAQKRGDASLYHLIYEAAHSTRKYSSRHALLCLTICELVASLLQWKAEWIDSLGRAALLMNVSMLRLQDQLAGDDRPLKAEIKAEIQDHPDAQRSAAAGLRLRRHPVRGCRAPAPRRRPCRRALADLARRDNWRACCVVWTSLPHRSACARRVPRCHR